jgi:ribonuclease P protein component
LARFSRDRRIRKRSEYLLVQGCGVTARTRHFVVIVYFRENDSLPRLGIVASKRVGNAVTRNRGKRKIRQWFHSHDSLTAPGADVVIILRKGAADLDAPNIAAQIDAVLPRLVRKARAVFSRARTCADAAKNAP